MDEGGNSCDEYENPNENYWRLQRLSREEMVMKLIHGIYVLIPILFYNIIIKYNFLVHSVDSDYCLTEFHIHPSDATTTAAEPLTLTSSISLCLTFRKAQHMDHMSHLLNGSVIKCM